MVEKNKRALIVVTSHGELGQTGRKTGFHYAELATPYWKFVDVGYGVDIVSIKGGAAPVDPSSVEEPGKVEATVERF